MVLMNVNVFSFMLFLAVGSLLAQASSAVAAQQIIALPGPLTNLYLNNDLSGNAPLRASLVWLLTRTRVCEHA
jgi:hypothetical protein